jgi:hypothetical protein
LEKKGGIQNKKEVDFALKNKFFLRLAFMCHSIFQGQLAVLGYLGGFAKLKLRVTFVDYEYPFLRLLDTWQ